MPREGLGELALAALGASADGFTVFHAERGRDGEVTRFVVDLVNDVSAQWAGRDVGECSGLDLLELDPAALDTGRWALMRATLADGEPRRLRTKQPEPRVTLECLMTRHGVQGAERVVVATRDVTELVAGERLLAAAYEMTAEVRATLQTALDATTDAFAVYDVERDAEGEISGLRLVLINLAGALPLADGGDPDELVGQDLRDFYPAAVGNGLWDAVRTAMERQATTQFRLTNSSATSPSGVSAATMRAWDNTIAPVGEERVVITWRDVSDEVRHERELAQAHDDAHYAAMHDGLTGLANRSLLMEELTEALWSSADDERVGVVFIDLDGFKGSTTGSGMRWGTSCCRRWPRGCCGSSGEGTSSPGSEVTSSSSCCGGCRGTGTIGASSSRRRRRWRSRSCSRRARCTLGPATGWWSHRRHHVTSTA